MYHSSYQKYKRWKQIEQLQYKKTQDKPQKNQTWEMAKFWKSFKARTEAQRQLYKGIFIQIFKKTLVWTLRQ